MTLRELIDLRKKALNIKPKNYKIQESTHNRCMNCKKVSISERCKHCGYNSIPGSVIRPGPVPTPALSSNEVRPGVGASTKNQQTERHKSHKASSGQRNRTEMVLGTCQLRHPLTRGKNIFWSLTATMVKNNSSPSESHHVRNDLRHSYDE